MPWSIETIRYPNKIANFYEKKCLSTVDRFLYPLPKGFKKFQDYYGEMRDDQLVHFKALVDLSFFDAHRKIIADPKILSARVMGEAYRQDLLIKALPKLVKHYPNIQVSLIIGQNPDQGRPYFDQMVALAKQLQVDSYCWFIDRTLSREEFAELIRTHNVVYSVAIHDVGFSSTNIQAAYSGAVTIIQDSDWVDGIFEDRVHVLKTQVDEQHVAETLMYAARHLERLQRKFIKNNRKLKQFAKEPMMENLIRCYADLVESSRWEKGHGI